MGKRVYLYSVRDVLAGEFGPLYTAVNNAVAMRNFRRMLSEMSEEMRVDYKLYCLGFMFIEEGYVTSYEKLEEVVGDDDEKQNLMFTKEVNNE